MSIYPNTIYHEIDGISTMPENIRRDPKINPKTFYSGGGATPGHVRQESTAAFREVVTGDSGPKEEA